MVDESNAETGQAPTFVPFGRLPKELRDKIWDLAIRKKSPGFHIFNMRCKQIHIKPYGTCDGSWKGNCGTPCDDGVCHTKEDEIDPRHLLHFHSFEERTQTDVSLSRFNVSNGQPQTFKGQNASAFAIDSALWTTCHESKEAMERFLSHHNQHCLPGDVNGVTGLYLNDEAQWQRFTVLGHDLLFFQPCTCHLANFRSDRGNVPLVNQTHGLKNIAFEFHKNWGPEEFELWFAPTRLDQMIRSALDYADDFWLVDYRIRRRHTRKPAIESILESNRKVFCGNDCRLVEVRISDSEEWEFADGSPLHPDLDTDERPGRPRSSFSNPFELNLIWYYAMTDVIELDEDDTRWWSNIEEWWEGEMEKCHMAKHARLHVLAFENCD